MLLCSDLLLRSPDILPGLVNITVVLGRTFVTFHKNARDAADKRTNFVEFSAASAIPPPGHVVSRSNSIKL